MRVFQALIGAFGVVVLAGGCSDVDPPCLPGQVFDATSRRCGAPCEFQSCDDGNDCTVDDCDNREDGTAKCSNPAEQLGVMCRVDGDAGECDGQGSCISTSDVQVQATMPIDGAIGVPIETTVSATMNVALDPSSVGDDSLRLERDSTVVAGEVTLGRSGTAVIFTPDAPLALAVTYTATLSGVDSLSGMPLVQPKTWLFTVRDGQWGTAVPLETDDTGAAEHPELAVDPNGNVTVVWHQFDGTSLRDIWSNRYAGNTWGAPTLVERDGSGSAERPHVAVDPDGNATAVWGQFVGGVRSTWSSRYVPGMVWGAAVLLETDDSGSTSDPRVAVDPEGSATAVWSQLGAAALRDVWSNRYTGGSWGAALLIETNDGGTANSPRVAVGPNGNATVVWSQSDGEWESIWSNRYSGGSWDAAVLIENRSGIARNPELAVDINGNATAVWHQDTGARSDIWSNRYSGGSWGTAVIIETEDTDRAILPRLAVDHGGNVTVVWYQNDSVRWNIWSNRYASGRWEAAQMIETNDASSAYGPDVAVDPNGNATAVWYHLQDGRREIWSNRYTGGSWGTAVIIGGDEGGGGDVVVAPRVAVDPDGHATAVWAQHDGTRTKVYANRLE